VSVERRHAAHDQRRRCHHYKKPHRFEFSGHALGRQPCAILGGNRNLADLPQVTRGGEYLTDHSLRLRFSAANDVTIYLLRRSLDLRGTIHHDEAPLLTSHFSPSAFRFPAPSSLLCVFRQSTLNWSLTVLPDC
jgi:hypothetical protein